MREPWPTSYAGLVAQEQKEQKANDEVIAALIAEDVEKGPLLEPNTKKDAANIHKINTKATLSHSNNIIQAGAVRATQPREARLANIAPQVSGFILSNYLENKDIVRLSTSCVTLYKQTEEDRRKQALQQLLQAMLHDEQLIVSGIINSYPKFLLAKPEDYGISEIESQFTWLRYLTAGETVFSMAQKLRLVDIVNILLKVNENYRLELEKEHWIMPAFMATKPAEQKEMQENYIQDYLLPFITALAADTTIQVSEGQNPETHFYEVKIENASENTIREWEAFREKLFKPKAIQDCVDVDQLLIAGYIAAVRFFNRFQNWHQRDAYGVWGLGLLQSLIDPKLGKIFCQSLDDVVYRGQPLSNNANSLILEGNRSFYRSANDSVSGLGFDFLCSIYGGSCGSLADAGAAGGKPWLRVVKLYQAKVAEVAEFTLQLRNLAAARQSRCVIF